MEDFIHGLIDFDRDDKKEFGGWHGSQQRRDNVIASDAGDVLEPSFGQ